MILITRQNSSASSSYFCPTALAVRPSSCCCCPLGVCSTYISVWTLCLLSRFSHLFLSLSLEEEGTPPNAKWWMMIIILENLSNLSDNVAELSDADRCLPALPFPLWRTWNGCGVRQVGPYRWEPIARWQSIPVQVVRYSDPKWKSQEVPESVSVVASIGYWL